jgi:hypothetical protein
LEDKSSLVAVSERVDAVKWREPSQRAPSLALAIGKSIHMLICVDVVAVYAHRVPAHAPFSASIKIARRSLQTSLQGGHLTKRARLCPATAALLGLFPQYSAATSHESLVRLCDTLWPLFSRSTAQYSIRCARRNHPKLSRLIGESSNANI